MYKCRCFTYTFRYGCHTDAALHLSFITLTELTEVSLWSILSLFHGTSIHSHISENRAGPWRSCCRLQPIIDKGVRSVSQSGARVAAWSAADPRGVYGWYTVGQLCVHETDARIFKTIPAGPDPALAFYSHVLITLTTATRQKPWFSS